MMLASAVNLAKHVAQTSGCVVKIKSHRLKSVPLFIPVDRQSTYSFAQPAAK